MGQDRGERRCVALDLGEALVRRDLLVDPRDRVEVRVAEEQTTELVNERVLELRLGKTTGRGARRRRRSWSSGGRWDRADRNDRADRQDRAAAARGQARRGRPCDG